MRTRWIIVIGAAVVAVTIWATDSVTLQDKRSIYTVVCVNGTWSGHKCNGVLSAGPLYTYRTIREQAEVTFKVSGDDKHIGSLFRCTIIDGRNWTCPPANADTSRSVTLEILKGRPTANPAWPTLPLHQVSKLNWLILNTGLSLQDSDEGE